MLSGFILSGFKCRDLQFRDLPCRDYGSGREGTKVGNTMRNMKWDLEFFRNFENKNYRVRKVL